MVAQIRWRFVFQICADWSSTMASLRRRLRRKVAPSILASDRIPGSVVAPSWGTTVGVGGGWVLDRRSRRCGVGRRWGSRRRGLVDVLAVVDGAG
ncbi:hypothetical protein TIFTF001_032463 [Ficus carica]|uniref:Uncharacterized protein n=1 Tax=Ficus carica TaxID=3494 RepID=A0AA88E0E1_FICCA|nr:hypothetical protein TIFTF001_032463 [Ficus carica]